MRSPALLLLVASAAPLLAACAAPGTDRRPHNVVVFLVDDLGWQDLSVPMHTERTEWNDRYRTPNVERLAARGVRFRQGYASASVCTPSRTSLMTGRSPGQSHITYWTLRADRDQSAPFDGLAPPAWDLDGLGPADVTLPGVLSDHGYRTIHVGKAHLGAKGSPGDDPTALGFDVNVAGHGAGAPGSYYGRDGFSAAGRRGSRDWDVPGLEELHGEDVFLTEVLAERACAEVRAASEAGQPFFLHFAPYAVHTPIQANPRWVGDYAHLDEREAAYASLVASIDAALGRVLDTLEELGLDERTYVVFTSDNGGLSAHARGGEPHTHNAPLRSGKGSAYEGGLRVPWIIAGPGVAGPRACDEPVITHDLFPTVLGWAGIAAPRETAPLVEGRDLGPLCGGLERFEDPRALFWNQPHFWGVRGPGIWPFSAVRQGEWKLLYRHGDRGFELYDLGADVGETTDLAEAEPERVREMAGALSRWIERRGVQLSIDAEDGAPIARPDRAALGE